MGPEPLRVRFADGFERPERIAFGLEAPQLAVVVVGSLLAWSLYHGPAPLAVRAPLALLIGGGSAALGWGRWQERPLLTWAWLALRFVVLPRSGGPVLLSAAPPEAGGPGAGGDGGDPGPTDGPAGAPAGAPPP
ncbi:MAG TPA: hypothetical protein VI316_12230, partial [Candidatus Dormibacteraeota bacterium]